jgi:hypothetical protein
MMMPPTSDLALHLATLRTLAEARAAVQRSRKLPLRVVQPPGCCASLVKRS